MQNGFSSSGSMERRRADRWETRPLVDSVLHLIWREQRISRAEIARQIGISRSTVTEVIKELLSSGFIKEVGSGASSGGRRPIVLEFQNDKRFVLGIDIGATHVSATLIDLSGKVLAYEKCKHSVRSDPEGTRKLVINISDLCLSQVDRGIEKLLSIGVALPSPVDPDHPDWLSELVIPAWRGRSELESLHQYFGAPVFVDNDANLGALAEYRWGAGRGVEDLSYVKIGFGIGAGFILKGQIYRGASGFAGEMGHIPVDTHGEQCICGLKGCLVTKVGGVALEERVSTLLGEYPESLLNGSKPSLEKIEIAARKGDPLALKLYAEVADYFSLAIAGWINMMNPGRVILGGSHADLCEYIKDPIQQRIQDCLLVGSTSQTSILCSELGERAESIGAATLALEEALSIPGFYKQTTANQEVHS